MPGSMVDATDGGSHNLQPMMVGPDTGITVT
jgi:hypothetical protein